MKKGGGKLESLTHVIILSQGTFPLPLQGGREGGEGGVREGQKVRQTEGQTEREREWEGHK